jgi:hypothetical protein
MTDVSSATVEGRDDLYTRFDSEPQRWEKTGKAAYSVFSAIAVGAFIPALAKKKRVYSLNLPGQAPQIIEVAEEPAIERALDLPAPHCTAMERGKVEKIFNTVAANNVVGLAWHSYQLIKTGNEIDHIHPFSFLLAAPKEQVRLILLGGSDLKIRGVMKGVIKGMEREYAKNNLGPYIPSFAAEMGKDPAPIKALIASRNWKELVDYLFLR